MLARMIKRRPVHLRARGVIERQDSAVQRQILRPARPIRLRHLEQGVAIGPQLLEMLSRRLQAEIFSPNYVPLMFRTCDIVKPASLAEARR
jgi:hypothetical protein